MLKNCKKKVLSIVLALAMILGLGYAFPVNEANAASVDVGANPTPKVDIAVSVPSDYPGTFLDFKEELTQKLLAQGMPADSFRITDTATKIDTTDLSGWLVYDHYRDEATYNSIVPVDQRAAQPYRAADNTHTNGTGTIESYFKNNTNTTNNACKNFDRHIYSSTDSEGKASMVFAGYGTIALSDFMIYPAASDSRRTFSFDINPVVIDAHTLSTYGFFLNAGIKNNVLNGYALIFTNGHVGSIQKINNLAITTANNTAQTISGSSTIASNISMGITAGQKARLTVELNKNSVTIQCQNYDANGNLGAPKDLVKNLALEDTGYNGFGPLVNYSGHGCASLSIMKYSDLEMTYDSSAFDALKTTQYYEGAQQKYFINLTGDSGDPKIPDATDPTFKDGINRMNENEIFYISNADDGKILQDPKDGTVGLGSENGYIANGDNYTELMAQYIYSNYIEGAKFKQNKIDSELPLANFYLTNADTGEQLMTVHLQHLVNAKEYNKAHPEDKVQDYINVGFNDKSKPGTLAGENGKIAQWRGKVIDPNNNVVYDSDWQTDSKNIQTYTFNSDSAYGKWTFELSVKDQNGNESKASQTYIVAFLDDKMPNITGENTGRNKATITLTDTGMGIDEDGITFIEDNRGSGVAAYWVTNDMNATPTENDWITLDMVEHSCSFDVDVDSADPLIVFVRDECGNEGSKAVFQPTHVIVKDPDGNELDDYYVIGDKPIIVLPDDPGKPDGEDGDFSGWITEGGDPVTPGTDPEPDDDNTIVIKPDYTTDKANLVYMGNGGTFTAGVTQTGEVVPSKSSILKKVGEFTEEPTRTGYTFTGWKLLKDTNTANLSNVEDITDQRAICVKDDAGNITRDTYYLVAQWEIGKYRVNFDPNGGSYGNVQYIGDVDYGTSVGTLAVPVSGRGIPSRNGYIFMGWSSTKNSADDYSGAFKAAQGQTVTVGQAPVVGDKDLTVYAMWKKDTSQFVVSFDSKGGSIVKAQAYLANNSSVTKYDTFLKPSKAGYTFDGWYLESDTGFAKEYKGGEAFVQKTDHTFVAKWNANTDTKYTIDYFVNSGDKDAQGNYIYTKVNDATQNLTAPTDSSVNITDDYIKGTITSDEVEYWYNPENKNNVLSGTVTGSPTLSLRMYFDRYFDVTATSKGNGTVTGAKKQKEGTTPTVSWKAAEGSYVDKVVVDGKIRDDLLNADSYTYPDGIYENHTVYVEFAEKGTTQPPVVVKPENKTYEIRTLVLGCPDANKYEITPTSVIKDGEDATVTWKVNDANLKVVKVEVDGVTYDVNKTSVDFTKVSKNHNVVVTLEELATIGGGTTPGNYTITVNHYGGDGKEVISPSMVLNAGESGKIEWDVTNSTYQIYKILVDGKEKTIGNNAKLKNGSFSISNVKENHVVDVYLVKPDESGEIEVPPYGGDEFVQVTTQLVGGPKTITGGAVLEKKSDYDVAWRVNPVTDVNSPDYEYYDVVKVLVNGKETSYDEDNDTIYLKDINEDTDVKVYLEPVTYNVTINKFGEGTVSPSKTLYYLQNYRNIGQKAADGWVLARIVVDGSEIYKNPDLPVAPAKSRAIVVPEDKSNTISNDPAVSDEESVVPEEEKSAAPDESDTISNDPAASEDETVVPEEKKSTAPDESGAISNDPSASEDATVISEEGGKTAFILNVPVAFAANKPAVLAAANGPAALADIDVPNIDDIEGIKDDHVIDVYFTKVDAEGNLELLPNPATLHTVRTKITGGPGEISGAAMVEGGADDTITWTFDEDKYEVASVTVNGKEVEVTGKKWKLENITSDMDVIVALDKKTLPGNDDSIPGNIGTVTHTVEAIISGVTGTITGNGTVNDGDSRTITWTADDPAAEVVYIYVNGVAQDISGLKDNSFTLGSITVDMKVVVVLSKPGVPPVNIDKDDDGKPDTNLDTDGDGKPDVNVDTDDDGEPDINIDTDDDGKPDVDVDTDDDGKPDVNVDTDDDGKPDINIDTDDDGKPDINIDTDKDGKPDINIDTDKDGKPDINIDTDGDGKPDINIDTDGDGKPDKNIDANGDGIPDNNGKSNVKGNTTKGRTPKTGDISSHVAGYMILFGLAAAVILFVFYRRFAKDRRMNK